MKLKLLLLGILTFSSIAWSFEYPYLMRSPKALLMGDAYTAVNDDEYTLFYNPATLGRNKYDLHLHPFSGYISGTNIVNDLDRFKDFPDTPTGVADVLMDYPVHAGGGVVPGFKLFNVGVSFMATQSFDALLRNQAHPMLDLDLRNDRGVVMGVGIPLGPSRVSKKSFSGSQTSFGIAAKYVERTGLRDTLSLTGPTAMDAIGKDELNDLLESLGKVRGIGWGFDAGFEHVYRAGNTQFVIGLAALDITGTEFEESKTENKLQVADTSDQINLGLAAGQNFGLFHYILSADVRELNEQVEFGKRLRFGAQFGIPGITLMGGVNSGYYSYGAELNMGFMKLSGGLYDIEMGSKYKHIQSKRFIIYLSLFDFSFDA